MLKVRELEHELKKQFREMCGKKEFAHPSQDAAEEHLHSLLQKPGVQYPERLHTYMCPYSDPQFPHWHVGHYKKLGEEKSLGR